MQNTYQLENKLMEEIYAELKTQRKLSAHMKGAIEKAVGERFTNGWELANSRKVLRYEFKPSGRVVWAIQGRKSEYQVIPDLPFCYCDDYYFRVMDKKRGLCYHIIAQRIAEALNKFERIPMNDSQYSGITDRWRVKEVSEKSE